MNETEHLIPVVVIDENKCDGGDLCGEQPL